MLLEKKQTFLIASSFKNWSLRVTLLFENNRLVLKPDKVILYFLGKQFLVHIIFESKKRNTAQWMCSLHENTHWTQNETESNFFQQHCVSTAPTVIVHLKKPWTTASQQARAWIGPICTFSTPKNPLWGSILSRERIRATQLYCFVMLTLIDNCWQKTWRKHYNFSDGRNCKTSHW